MFMERLKQIINGEKYLSNETIALIFLLFAVGTLIYIDKTKPEIKPIEIVEHKELQASINGDFVLFNTNSKKFHKLNCKWAKKCKNCIKIKKEDALKNGGKPCRACGQ